MNEIMQWIQNNPEVAVALIGGIFGAIGFFANQIVNNAKLKMQQLELDAKEEQLRQEKKIRELEIKEREENLRHTKELNRISEMHENNIKKAEIDNIKADTENKKADTKLKVMEATYRRINRTNGTN